MLTLVRRMTVFASLAVALASANAATDGGAQVAIEAGPQDVHALVIDAQAWGASHAGVAVRFASSGAADFAVLDAGAALSRRIAGEALKAVFVVSRQPAGNTSTYRVLVVRESLMARDPAIVERVVGQFESARQWLGGHQEEAAALIAKAGGISQEAARNQLARSDLQVARPGPALAHALKSRADPTHAAQIDALIDDGPMRAAARTLQRGDRAALLSLR